MIGVNVSEDDTAECGFPANRGLCVNSDVAIVCDTVESREKGIVVILGKDIDESVKVSGDVEHRSELVFV